MVSWARPSPTRRSRIRSTARPCSGRSSRAWARTTSYGAPTRCGTGRPSARSKRSDASRYRTRCRRSTASRRAFFIGLALPYLLWGFIADAQLLAQPRRARAQAEKPAPGAPATPAAPEQPGSPIWLKINGHTGPPRRLTIQILGTDEGKKTPLDKARTSLLRADALTE